VKIRGELFVAFVVCILFIFSSCGYGFRGGGNLPAGVKRLSIKILENRTSETGVENIFTNDLIYEITTHGSVILTDESSADAILSGVIKAMRIDQISHRDSYASLERRVTVTLTLKLKDPTGKIIWSAKDVTENEEYNVSSNKQTTENNRQEAIIALSERLAEKIYNRLTDDF
jgi:outer membrane lipopolysaccharide assembly protein LptE/RlpB